MLSLNSNPFHGQALVNNSNGYAYPKRDTIFSRTPHNKFVRVLSKRQGASSRYDDWKFELNCNKFKWKNLGRSIEKFQA